MNHKKKPVIGKIVLLLGIFSLGIFLSSLWGMPAIAGNSSANFFSYLPIATKPFSGTIKLSSKRSKGPTTFVPDVTLDFSQLGFGDKKPDKVKLWPAVAEEPSGEVAWQEFSETEFTYKLNPNIIGAQSLNVRFLYGNAPSVSTETTIFYLPNGDFTDDTIIPWQFIDVPLPVKLVAGKLRLGHAHDDINFDFCKGVPLGAAVALLDEIQLPEDVDYKLFVEAKVYTYDKLPDPNEAKFDAFEVHLSDGQTETTERYGNSQAPLNCQTPRVVDVMDDLPLNLYTGMVTIKLENWSRYDHYYNTYTEIDTIWVDK